MSKNLVVKKGISLSPDADRIIQLVAGDSRQYSTTISAMITLMTAAAGEATAELRKALSKSEIEKVRRQLAGVALTPGNVAGVATMVEDVDLAVRIVRLSIPARVALFIEAKETRES